VSHRNAPLSELGRLRLARCVVDDGWPLRRAAERFQLSPTTAARWAGRYRLAGVAGMVDRSSRPHRSPGRTPTRTERRIIKVRVLRHWRPARIGYLLGLHPSTVNTVCSRLGRQPADTACSAMKTGIIAMIKVAALECAATGTRLNAICPGPVATPDARKILKQRWPTVNG
jgi:NAD(P)-dependent dehydrogenase (short-subunit alcohol dehydrogenase family)